MFAMLHRHILLVLYTLNSENFEEGTINSDKAQERPLSAGLIFMLSNSYYSQSNIEQLIEFESDAGVNTARDAQLKHEHKSTYM